MLSRRYTPVYRSFSSVFDDARLFRTEEEAKDEDERTAITILQEWYGSNCAESLDIPEDGSPVALAIEWLAEALADQREERERKEWQAKEEAKAKAFEGEAPDARHFDV